MTEQNYHNSNAQADFVIVGAGSAGCVLAERLSASGKHKVVLLEAGAKDTNPWLHIPIGYAKTYHHPTLNWGYHSEPIAGLGQRRSYWPRGKVLGGSSAINAMVYIRGQQDDYADWQAAGAYGWGWQDVLPYFKALENNSAGADQWRSTDGPIGISESRPHCHSITEHFLDAATELGYLSNDDFNGASQEGVGCYQINTAKGQRVSAARGFLNPAKQRANLQIITKAQVSKLICAGKRCTGVCYERAGQFHEINVKAEVILCSGAVNSPQLLQLSGIGPAALLKELGINIIQDTPAVGQHLQDHIGFGHYYKSKIPTLNNHFNNPLRLLAYGLQYALRRSGPLALSVNQGGGFIRSNATRQRPNIQLYCQPISWLNSKPGVRPMVALDKFAGFNLGVSQCRPLSRGEINIHSTDHHQAPRISPNYLARDEDVDELLEAAKILRQFAATSAMQNIIEDELQPGLQCQSDQALIEDIRARSDTIFHPSCTCRMGQDITQSVVNERLQVHGIGNLRVADASVFPNVISGNTNAPSMMVGAKAADLILADH